MNNNPFSHPAKARFHLRSLVIVGTLAVAALSPTAFAQDKEQAATIQKNLSSIIPNMPEVQEVTKTPIDGLYEVRFAGSELIYTNKDGSYAVHGTLLDTVNKKNLTQDKQDKLTAIDFKSLPFKNSFKVVKGKGTRQVAVFEDPNCGFCKKFEKDMQAIDDVTFHIFLYPVLGADSIEKSNNIWCAKDKKKVWLDWMVDAKPIPEAACKQTSVAENVEFGRKHRIQGTPMLLLEDGTRIPGAVTAQELESKLKSVGK